MQTFSSQENFWVPVWKLITWSDEKSQDESMSLKIIYCTTTLTCQTTKSRSKLLENSPIAVATPGILAHFITRTVAH
jgi:hypothetical protein